MSVSITIALFISIMSIVESNFEVVVKFASWAVMAIKGLFMIKESICKANFKLRAARQNSHRPYSIGATLISPQSVHIWQGMG